MTRDETLRAFDSVRVWQRGDRRAVHKPLLILYALSKVASGAARMNEWAEIEPHLKSLLEEFGPNGSANSRHYPFWHLQTDKLWELDGPEGIRSRPPASTPTLTELREYHFKGGFPEGIYKVLQSDPQLIATIADRIVDAHFPESIRADVLETVGLPAVSAEINVGRRTSPRRDPAFREGVLLAYQYKCGICGHDLRLGRQPIGLEAAHIKWVQAQGPDVVPNGIAMCSLHHKVFDLGAFTILPNNFQIVFSQHLNGGDSTTERMLAHHGANLLLPQSKDYLPSPDFLNWHEREVFKRPKRT